MSLDTKNLASVIVLTLCNFAMCLAILNGTPVEQLVVMMVAMSVNLVVVMFT